jgi:hypothetical protein
MEKTKTMMTKVKRAKTPTTHAKRTKKAAATALQIPALDAPVVLSVPGQVADEPVTVEPPVRQVARAPRVPRTTRSLADKLAGEARSYLRKHAKRPYGVRGQTALDALIERWRQEQGDEVLADPLVTAYMSARASSVGVPAR